MVDNKERNKRRFKCKRYKCGKFDLDMNSMEASAFEASKRGLTETVCGDMVSVDLNARSEQCCCSRDIARFRVESNRVPR